MEMEAPTDGLLGLHVRLRVVEKHSRFVFVFVFLPFFLLRNSQFAIYNERFFSFTDNGNILHERVGSTFSEGRLQTFEILIYLIQCTAKGRTV